LIIKLTAPRLSIIFIILTDHIFTSFAFFSFTSTASLFACLITFCVNIFKFLLDFFGNLLRKNYVNITKQRQFLNFREYQGQNKEVAKTDFWRANGLTQFAFNWILCSPDLTPMEFFFRLT
jgi:hypothetical protein